MFLSMTFLNCWYCPLSSVMLGFLAIADNIPHAVNKYRFVLFCGCVCLCV
jgi:hypothetical protein